MQFGPEQKKFITIACCVGALIGVVWALFVPLPGAPSVSKEGIGAVMSYSFSTFSYAFMAGLGGAIAIGALALFVMWISSQE
jgi:hypothetical protein